MVFLEKNHHMIFSWFVNIFNVWSILKYAKNALAKYVFQVAKCKDLMFIANWFVFETRINGFNFLIMGLLRRGFKLLAMMCCTMKSPFWNNDTYRKKYVNQDMPYFTNFCFYWEDHHWMTEKQDHLHPKINSCSMIQQRWPLLEMQSPLSKKSTYNHISSLVLKPIFITMWPTHKVDDEINLVFLLALLAFYWENLFTTLKSQLAISHILPILKLQ